MPMKCINRIRRQHGRLTMLAAGTLLLALDRPAMAAGDSEVASLWGGTAQYQSSPTSGHYETVPTGATYSGNATAPQYSNPTVPAREAPSNQVRQESFGADTNVQIVGEPLVETPNRGPGALDERPFWRLYRKGNYAGFTALIDKERASHPTWVPSSALERAVSQIEVGNALNLARREHDWRGALAIRAAHPELFDCNHVYNDWKLADTARALGLRADEIGIYDSILATCQNEPDRIITISRYGAISNDEVIDQLFANERTRVSGAQELENFDAGYDQYRVGLLSRLVFSGHLQSASLLAPQLERQIFATRNADGASALGWLQMKRGHPAAAIPFFQRAAAWKPNAKHAADLALAEFQSGHPETAMLIAQRYPGNPAFTPLQGAILIHQAQDAYAAKAYAQAIAIVNRAVALGLDSHDFEMVRAWSLYQMGSPEAASLFARLAGQDRDAAAEKGLLYALLAECPVPVAGQPVALTAPSQSPPVCMEAAIRRVGRRRVYDRIRRLETVAASGNPPDPKLSLSLGYFWTNVGTPERAQYWFDHARQTATSQSDIDAATAGSINLMNNSGQYEKVRAMLEAHWDDPKWTGLYAASLRGLGQQAYDAKDYAKSLDLMQQAAAIDPPGRGARLTTAWDEFHLGHTDTSWDSFRALYQEAPGADAASGLVATAESENKLDRLKTVTGPIEPFLPYLRAAYSDQAYDRDQFLLAHSENPEHYPQLDGIDTPTFRADVMYRDKSGTSGQGQLTGETAFLAEDFGAGADWFTLSETVDHLESGHLGAGSAFGSPGVRRFAADSGTGVVVEPSLSWWHQGPLEVKASIGTTAVNARAVPTVAGSVELTRYQNNGGRVSVGLSRLSNRESVLALTGARDPVTGHVFGRVVENAFHIETFQPLGNEWGLSAQLKLGYLEGIQVRSNTDVNASVGVAKNIASWTPYTAQNFSYISVGPQIQYEGFAHNLSGFTIGQGGYFSPQSFYQIGPSVVFETLPVGRLVAHGGAGLGWQKSYQAPLPGTQGGTNDSSIGGSFFGDLSYQISPRLMLDAGIQYDANPSYNETRVLLGLHIPFGPEPRASTTVDDLPDQMFQ